MCLSTSHCRMQMQMKSLARWVGWSCCFLSVGITPFYIHLKLVLSFVVVFLNIFWLIDVTVLSFFVGWIPSCGPSFRKEQRIDKALLEIHKGSIQKRWNVLHLLKEKVNKRMFHINSKM
jgi:hypothetical protein